MHSYHHLMSFLDEQALHRKFRNHQQTQAEIEKAERKLNDLLQQKEYYCSEIRCEAMKHGQFDNVIEMLVNQVFETKFPELEADIERLLARLSE